MYFYNGLQCEFTCERKIIGVYSPAELKNERKVEEEDEISDISMAILGGPQIEAPPTTGGTQTRYSVKVTTMLFTLFRIWHFRRIWRFWWESWRIWRICRKRFIFRRIFERATGRWGIRRVAGKHSLHLQHYQEPLAEFNRCRMRLVLFGIRI